MKKCNRLSVGSDIDGLRKTAVKDLGSFVGTHLGLEKIYCTCAGIRC